ncbi:MAG: hypothetical protein ABIN25_11360, partial [Ginsengibacter sp.]
MNVDTNAAASSLSDLSMDIDTLEKHAEAFPFSAYVRYLLLLQYKKHGHNNFEKELQKTALYFTNAQWLEFQLANTNNGEGESPHDSYSDTHHFAVLTEEQIENTDHSEANTDIDDESVLLQTKTQQEEILPATENVIESSTENNLEVVTTNEEIIAAEE